MWMLCITAATVENMAGLLSSLGIGSLLVWCAFEILVIYMLNVESLFVGTPLAQGLLTTTLLCLVWDPRVGLQRLLDGPGLTMRRRRLAKLERRLAGR